MTRNLSEDSDPKRISASQWDIRQLYRRPSLPPGEEVAATASAMLVATKGAFTQSGLYAIGWDDVDTDDVNIFGIGTSGGLGGHTKDEIQLKVQGLYLAIATVFPTVASSDYSVQWDIGNQMLPAVHVFPTFLGAVDGDPAVGSQAWAIRLMHCRATPNVPPGAPSSTTRLLVTRAGTKAFTYAACYVLYFPATAPGATFTDIG